MILQNDFKRQWDEIAESVLAAVRRVGSSGWYILGKDVDGFEKALAEFWGVAHAVGTANGLDALEIGLRCLNLQPGDKVLTTPLSAFATTLAILRAGGVPVFADVDNTGAIDLTRCRQLLERDKSIRFFVPVHLYGVPLALEELGRLQRDFDLRVVEDCAQSIGASVNDLRTGTVGQVAATSFYPTKNLGALGDGGAVLTNDNAIAAAARELRNYGQSAHYIHSRFGLNSRLDELHAAILQDAFLPRLNGWTAARRVIAERYLREIHNPALQTLALQPGANPVWHLFPVLVRPASREKFRAHLEACGILTGIHYPRIIPHQTALAGIPFEKASQLDNAIRFSDSEVSLPIHPFLTETEVETVIAACNNWSE
ncbi:MAG TPA: DegT/DnrJ/EryC1/StrS family aminotransferase [Chthoniobacterales bacterium]|nr:DegT/DnrJ/EryC1/StrS family aminotransferase [Chthoniobacterales bacterium]